MKLRFGIRSILILTAFVAVLVGVVGKPIFERRAEVRNFEALREVVVELEPQSATALGGAIVVVGAAQYNGDPSWVREPGAARSFDVSWGIPKSLSNSLHKRIHKDTTLGRVDSLALPVVNDEIVDLIRSFRHVRHIQLGRTELTNEQAWRLAEIPGLHILDCVETNVDYETLVAIRRKYPRLCDLAHRRALWELRRRGCGVHTDYRGDTSSPATHVRVHLTMLDDDVIDAVNHIHRPISSLGLTTSVDGCHEVLAWLDGVCQANEEIQVSLDIQSSGSVILPPPLPALSTETFRELSRLPLKRLAFTNVDLDDSNLIAPESLTLKSLQFTNAGSNLIRAFASVAAETVNFTSTGDLVVDEMAVSSSVKTMRLVVVKHFDLSHCSNVECVGLFGMPRTDEELFSLLELPELKELRLGVGGPISVSDVVRNAYKEKSVKLKLFPQP